MIDDTLFFMLVVGLVISAGMLFLFIWAAKSGQFDDASKMTNGDAVGVLQIRPIMVKELNRKLGYNKWKLSDRRDSLKSVLMFKDFIEIYEIENIERASREWNGGPTGMKKSATYSYYKKAKSYYSVYRNKTYGQLSLN